MHASSPVSHLWLYLWWTAVFGGIASTLNPGSDKFIYHSPLNGLIKPHVSCLTNTNILFSLGLKESRERPKMNGLYIQFSSVAQSCPTLCDPMNHSTPGLPVYHHLPEFTQTHVHQVSDAIQPSVVPSSPAPNPSQYQSLFQ